MFCVSGTALRNQLIQVEENTTTGHWDSVKGDHYCLMEVKITAIKGY